MTPLTSQKLDSMVAAGCQAPGCDHRHHDTMYINQRCHVSAPTQTRYCSKDKVIIVECAECKSEVARIKVAR